MVDMPCAIYNSGGMELPVTSVGGSAVGFRYARFHYSTSKELLEEAVASHEETTLLRHRSADSFAVIYRQNE